jgi:phenylacetate-CoA ligase
MSPATAYFAIQRVRGGVRPSQIDAARALLQRDAAGLGEHIRSRLVSLHGPEAADPAWLAGQAPVDRAALVDAHVRMIASLPAGVEVRRTSGSSGMPFCFVRSREMLAWMDAAMWAGYSWHGIEPGHRRLRFWGLAPGSWHRMVRRLADRATSQRRLSAFEITPERSRDFFRDAVSYRPRYAYGYPTLMSRWAGECMAAGLDGRELGLNRAITTGELLSPSVRRQLADFFGCPVVNEYGCTESGIVALECERGTAHMLPVAALAEVVDASGRPVSPGAAGEVVVTDLYGQVLPLVRYRLRDTATSGPAACACGRALPTLDVAIGREGSFIRLPSGRQVFSTALAYAVTPAVASFRAQQISVSELVADVTLRPGMDPAEAGRALEAAWHGALGREIRVRVRVVPALLPEPSGKLRYFIPMDS